MLSETARRELESLVALDEMQIGQMYRLMQEGVTSLKDFVARGAAGGVGVASTNRMIIRAILDAEIPNSSSISKYAYRAINRIRSNSDGLSVELNDYLDELQAQLDMRYRSTEAVARDVEKLVESSDKLADRVQDIKNAVYVYSFPTYLHYGTIEDPEYKWFKIGSTENAVWQRVVDQSRQTSMPEDPVLVRVYASDALTSMEIEKKFHRTLERVGHERSSASRTRAGKEWFATTEEALDALAELMNLSVISQFDFGDGFDSSTRKRR